MKKHVIKGVHSVSLRDLFVEIGVEVDDDPLKDLDDVMSEVKQAFEGMSDIDGLDDIKKDVESVSNKMVDLRKDTLDVDSAVDKLDRNDLNGLEKETKTTNKAMDTLKKNVMAVGIAIGGYFAVDTIKDFAVGAIEAAAEVQAIDAQFEQVFGNLEDTARTTLDNLGNEFGMLPSRLTAPYAQMTSMFKGLGYETKDASQMASDGLTLVADAAAFYDMSFEDANGAFNSFIKGNYEGGEAIGLFANETQMAAFAASDLGMEWKNLDEAGKQLVRLEYAEAMQAAAGATGQASRESEGYENVMGNLRQAWKDFQAEAGKEFLPHVITGIQWLTEKIMNFDPTPVIDGIYEIKDGFVEGYEAVTDFIDTYDWLIAGILGGVTAYYAITGAMAAYNAVVLFAMGTGPIYTAVTGAMTFATAAFGSVLVFITSPIGIAVLAIGALIAIGILLYQNWDIVKAKVSQGLEMIGGIPGVIAIVLGPLGFLINAAIDLAKNWDSTKTVWENVWGAIQRSAATSVNAVIGVINGLIKTLNLIPGVSIPLVAKVDWGSFKQAESIAATPQSRRTSGGGRLALDTGLGRVPYDDMPALLHKDEAVIQADDADALRQSGILQGDGRYPKIDLKGNRNNDNPKPLPTSTGGSGGPSVSVGSILIQVQGGNSDEETGFNLQAALDEYFTKLGIRLQG